MKQRWLFNLAAGLSLVLCVATGVLWARSYPGEKWELDGPRSIALRTHDGRFLIERQLHTVMRFAGNPPTTLRALNELDDPAARRSGWRYIPWSGEEWSPGDTWSGFGEQSAIAGAMINVGNIPIYQIRRLRAYFVPLWFPLLVFMVLPAVWMYRWVTKHRRAVPGICVKCGYDLRATPDRCPECGTSPEAPKGAAV